MLLEGNHLSLVYDTADFPVETSHEFSSLDDNVTSVGIDIQRKDETQCETSFTWQPLLHSHAMRILDIAETLQHCPNLKELQLHGVGLSMDSEYRVGPSERLKNAMQHHRNIVSIQLDEIYVVQQNRPDSWLFYSQLVQAISSSPTLCSLSISSTTAYFSRPILTLSALHSVLSHGQLKRLAIHHFNLWGTGSAFHCSEAIRRNTTLIELALTACVFAAAESMGDEESSSILSGFDTNRSIQHLDLTASMLPLEVAGLSAALLENKSLVSLTLTKTRMAFDPVLHGGRLCRILKSVASHPCLVELNLIDTADAQFIIHNEDEPACDSSLVGLRAFLNLVRDVVSENSIISKVRLDPAVVDHLLKTNMCTVCSTAILQIGISTGLNRAHYWDLTPESSSSQEWVEALGRVSRGDEEAGGVLASTIFQILTSNPLICSVE